MRKDVKYVVAAACLLLVGMLAYVLLAPSHKKAEVASDGTSTETSGGAQSVVPTEPQEPTAPAVNVALTPSTEPAVSVAVVPATQPSSVAVTGPVVPAVDSNVAVGTTSTAATDWDKTLNTGTVAVSTGVTHSSLPANTLIAATDTPAGAWTASTPTTRPSSPALVDANATAGAKTHKVVYGETLSSIAAEYYGNQASYTKILAANPGVNPNRLKVGTVLKIPDIKSTKPVTSGGTPTGAAEKASGMSGPTYAVKSGDSLQRISSKLYGTAEKWQKIYDLNRSSIGGDPHRLRAGLVLKLPSAPSSSAAAAQ